MFKYYYIILLYCFIVLGLKFSLENYYDSVIKEVNINYDNNKDVYFVGESMIKKAIISNNVGILKGKKVYDLNLVMIEKVLNGIPWIDYAHAHIGLNNTLYINFKQREPIVRIKTRKGEEYYIDKDKNKFILSENFSPRTIIAYGDIENGQIDYIKDIYNFINQDEFLLKQIIGIEVNNDSYSLNVRHGNHSITIGSISSKQELINKLDKMNIFYKKIISDKEWSSYSNINLEYEDRIICTKN